MKSVVFEVVKNRAGYWYWRERAANGQIKAHSEAYTRKYSATKAASKKAAQTLNATWKEV